MRQDGAVFDLFHSPAKQRVVHNPCHGVTGVVHPLAGGFAFYLSCRVLAFCVEASFTLETLDRQGCEGVEEATLIWLMVFYPED